MECQLLCPGWAIKYDWNKKAEVPLMVVFGC